MLRISENVSKILLCGGKLFDLSTFCDFNDSKILW